MLDKILNLTNNYLKDIQISFDNYQNNFFEKRSPEFFCLELNGEAGELANNEKKKWKGREVEHSLFEDEAADVFIALMNYCNARNINLSDALDRKLNYIENKRIQMLKEGKNF